MTWNYRMTKRMEYDVEVYEIREVYYDDEGGVRGWTEEAMAPYGETPEELFETLNKMLQAASMRPVLDLAVIEQELKELKDQHDASS